MGTLLGELLGFLLPPGVVKDFFLTSVYFDLAGLFGNANGVVTIDLVMFILKFGLEITINFASIMVWLPHIIFSVFTGKAGMNSLNSSLELNI